jgi:tripartite-type tricarboxylate transporter receptor subunit TctC
VKLGCRPGSLRHSDHLFAFLRRGPHHRGIARRHNLARLRRATASGVLKALAATDVHRWFDLPDVPTMVELGFKDFVSDTFQGFLAPAKTPPAIVELLSAKSIEVLKKPNIAERLRNNGLSSGLAGCESASKTRCRNGVTLSPRPASSRC